MKKLIRFLLILLLAISFTFTASEAAAQKVGAAAVVDQHYAAQSANYKLMMIGLALVYGVYLLLSLRRKKEMNRFSGKA